MTMHPSLLDHKVDLQMIKWAQSEKLPGRLAQSNRSNHVRPYLALSRETGACGSKIAKAVAERLEWDLLDNEIVDYMNEHYGTPHCVLQRVDERHENWLTSFIGSQGGERGVCETTYTHRVAKLLTMAASHGEVVIVGRGAKFILPANQGVSVRLVASMDFRIHQVMSDQGLDKAEAQRYVINTDRDREAYIKSHFHATVTDPHLYDLVLNVTELTIDEAAHSIIDYITKWKQKRA